MPVINSKAKCNDSMRVLYSNVDSFLNNVCLLVGCLTSQQHASVSQGRILNKKDEFLICITKEKPDILGLTEIRAKNERYAVKDIEYEIPHYDMFLNEEPKRGI